MTKQRNGIIDLMRFIFCIGIVFGHGRYLGNPTGTVPFAQGGYLGVEFYFLVSGFLMAMSASRLKQDGSNLGPETVAFLWKRIRTILPYYSFAVICATVRKIIVEDYSLVKTIHELMYGVWDLFFLRMSGIKSVSIVRATWYLSAMYFSMLILYPMLRRWGKTFTHVIAPVAALLMLGFLSQKYGNLDLYSNSFTIVYSGLIRALAEISLGCVCFAVYEKLIQIRFSTFARFLIMLVQLVGYAGFIYCQTNKPEGFDFVLLLVLAVCIPLSFSGQGLAVSLFRHDIFPWLGKFSLVVYLNHFWVKDTIAHLLPDSLGYLKLTAIYLLCVGAASLLCMLYAKLLCIFWNRFGSRIKGLFLKPEATV